MKTTQTNIAGDPLLSDGSGGVYGFAPDSPAHACDIEPVDVSQAGTREA